MRAFLFLSLLGLFFLACPAQEKAWRYVGPGEMKEQVKGMVTALWADPDDLNHVLAGSACGGLFKSENALSAQPGWVCISDTYRHVMSFGVTGIAVKPGTGRQEIFISSGHSNHLPRGYGNGILKTVNGGKSWEHAGPGSKDDFNFMLHGLVMNPENSDEMIAYSAKKIFFTRDAWKTWDSVVPPIDPVHPDISLCDAEFAPFEPGKFYLCTRAKDRSTAQVFQITNYGKTISDITPADLPSSRMELATVHQPRFKGKFYLAGGNAGIFLRFYDGRKYSPVLNAAGVNQVFAEAYWALEMEVNQKDTSFIYLAMTESSMSRDGGKTFEKIGYYNGVNTHADNRCMLLARSSAQGKDDHLFLGNDGGISYTTEFSPSKWRNLNGRGLDITQFWGVQSAESDSLFVAGGTADNGGFMISEKSTVNTMMGCGDGYLAVVPDAHSAVIECNPPSVYYHNQANARVYGLIIQDEHYAAKRPLILRDSVIYLGYGDLWALHSRKLAQGDNRPRNLSSIPRVLDQNGVVKNKSLSAIALSSEGSALLAFANPNWNDKENNGKVYYCTSLEKAQYIDISARLREDNGFELCRWSQISAIEFDSRDDSRFYILARDVFTQTNSIVYSASIDPATYAVSLRKINSNLPAVGINDLKMDEQSHVLYLAADNGVYFTYPLEDSIVWTQMNNGLPNVMVFGLDVNYHTNSLYSATFARGIWQAPLVRGLGNNIRFNRHSVYGRALKVDGVCIVEKNSSLAVKSKLIITKGSKIILKKKSRLVISKGTEVRNEFNEPLDPSSFIEKHRTARLIIQN